MSTSQEIWSLLVTLLVAVVVRVIDHYWPDLAKRARGGDNEDRPGQL